MSPTEAAARRRIQRRARRHGLRLSVASYTLIGVGPWRDYLLVPIVPDPEDDWMEEAGVVGIVFGAQTLEAVEAFLRTYKVEAAPKAMDSPS